MTVAPCQEPTLGIKLGEPKPLSDKCGIFLLLVPVMPMNIRKPYQVQSIKIVCPPAQTTIEGKEKHIIQRSSTLHSKPASQSYNLYLSPM